ncbi:polysaccharide biosynthesis protein [Lactiplantibacillus sp. DA1]|uniref:polysaccharide biosynthesis protein n=1 Tax=Lactiplantibacillus sp. DA1 TaxID=3079857 RepID=UPI00292A6519|nr:polysaccharide biosynthesis protein [Lactiplantibacillus sp. DA1]MDV0432189.1 polysaccharide biosynthesis protein [Lactiplantibacillus sp. DA1]
MMRHKVASLQQHRNALYLSIFGIYLASVTLQTTTFNDMIPHRVGVLVELATLAALLGLVVCLDALTLTQIIGEVSLLVLVTVVTLTSGAHYLMPTVMLVIGARHVSFRQIIQVYLGVVGTILLVALVAAEAGLIKNITFTTADGLRQSFGVVYTTDFAAHIFYLCAAYLYLLARRFRPVALLPVIIGLGIIYQFTKTMTDVIALVALVGVYLLYIYRRQLRWLRPMLRYSFLMLPIASGAIIGLSNVFNYQDRLLVMLNNALSTRLALGNNALLAYGVKLFGQAPIPINGWGGDRADSFTNGVGTATYFFIDSSFLNMLISYGLLLTLVLIIGITWFLYQRTRQHDYLLPVIFAAIAISSMFDQHFLEVTYNVFILMLFADLPNYRTAVGPEFERPVVIQRGASY